MPIPTPAEADEALIAVDQESFAHAMIRAYFDSGAKNCIQFAGVTVSHEGADNDAERFVITVQRLAGQTPLTLLATAEAERDAALARVAVLDAALREIADGACDSEDCPCVRSGHLAEEASAALGRAP